MSAGVDMAGLQVLARRLSAGELRSPRDWGGIVHDWAGEAGVRAGDAWDAFHEVSACELERRTKIAAEKGELHGRHWSLQLDIEMREAA